MFLLVQGIDIGQTIKIAVLTAIPIVVFVGVWIYLKNQMENEKPPLSKSMEALDEKILIIAKDKIAQREQQPQTALEHQLDKNEIEQKIKAERQEYDEFELVEPLEDLRNSDEKQD